MVSIEQSPVTPATPRDHLAGPEDRDDYITGFFRPSSRVSPSAAAGLPYCRHARSARCGLCAAHTLDLRKTGARRAPRSSSNVSFSLASLTDSGEWNDLPGECIHQSLVCRHDLTLFLLGEGNL